MNQTIINAITDKRTLLFYYDGEQRVVEPHCYGLDTKGHDALRAYQINKGWRFFHVEDMGLVQTGEPFEGPRPGYNPKDRHMDQIYAHL